MKHKTKIWTGLGLFVCLMTALAALRLYKSTTQDVITIGMAQWVSNPEYEKNLKGFKDQLAEKGYVEGQNVQFIVKNSEANKNKQRTIIRSFLDKEIDLIYTLTTPGTLIAKDIIHDIPIVFSIVTYPVEVAMIESLEHSGNNLVGTRNYVSPSKQYYIFERLYPDTKTLAFVHRKGEPNSVIQYNEYKKLLENRDITVLDIAAVDLDDMRVQLTSTMGTIDAMYSACDTLIQSGGEEIVIELSKRYKKPNFTCNKDGVLKGALVGNVADFYTIGRISGEKAALILRRAEPTWIQTESPREDYILVNTKTARELGITIPKDILQSAKEIITE